jgi:hypothetical protein
VTSTVAQGERPQSYDSKQQTDSETTDRYIVFTDFAFCDSRENFPSPLYLCRAHRTDSCVASDRAEVASPMGSPSIALFCV